LRGDRAEHGDRLAGGPGVEPGALSGEDLSGLDGQHVRAQPIDLGEQPGL
jgi:hypothetical protein